MVKKRFETRSGQCVPGGGIRVDRIYNSPPGGLGYEGVLKSRILIARDLVVFGL